MSDNSESADKQTNLINLNSLTLKELAELSDPSLYEMVEDVKKQVSRPRANLGSSGPPGRAD